MTITRDSAAVVLRLLTGAFPSPPLGEDSVGLYLDRMTSSPFDDVDLLLVVAEACVDTLDRMPTLHQLLIAYQGAARGKVADRMAADQLALERAGRARTGAPQPDNRFGQEMVDMIRTALAEALPVGDETRGHRHLPGVDPTMGQVTIGADTDGNEVRRVHGLCPVCSRKDEIADQFQTRVAGLLAARGVSPEPQPLHLRRCQRCENDCGFITVGDPTGVFTVRPCPECRTESYEDWQAGKLGVRRGALR